MRYYIESDGRVFLVARGDRLDLPTPAEVPFPVESIAPLAGDDVWFCVPQLARHPHEWHPKDDLVSMEKASGEVRQAVHATMPRVVVEGLCLRDDRILLVKGSRGLTEGRWTLPGGFMRFGEDPEACVLREIQEEVGLRGVVEAFVGIRSKLGRRTRLHWTMLFYRVRIDGEPTPDPDEIAEACFVELDRAGELLFGGEMVSILNEIGRVA